MTIQSRATLKGHGDTGDVPTEANRDDLIDSFLHLTDATAQTVEGAVSFTGNLTITTLATGMATAAAAGGTVHTVPTTAAGYLTVQVSGRTVAIPYFEV